MADYLGAERVKNIIPMFDSKRAEKLFLLA